MIRTVSYPHSFDLFQHTPIESYNVHGTNVWVKREDMCGPDGAPTFSKIRGLIPHLIDLKKRYPAVTTIGYVETSISMAGWGVAWACQMLGLQCIIFDPQYKPETELPILRYHRQQWIRFGATIRPIKAGMARVNWNVARNTMRDEFAEHGVLLQLGLPFEETIDATGMELRHTLTYQGIHLPKSIVVPVGSGTIVSGILQTVYNNPSYQYIKVIGVCVCTKNKHRLESTILSKAHLPIPGSLFDIRSISLELQDPGWEYTDSSTISCPFPCHPYYDLKAWQWLVENINNIAKPVLFWNIGRYDEN